MNRIQTISLQSAFVVAFAVAVLLPSLAAAATVRCDLEVSDERINWGEEVKLTWETTSATDVKLEDNHGNTLFDTDDLSSKDKKEFYDGDMEIKPSKNTTYTLTAERGSNDEECEVEVEVDRVGGVVLSEQRMQLPPPAAGVALSQVPYTGVDVDMYFGKMFAVVAMAWILLAIYNRRRLAHA
jgi:hypothetical protein